MCQRACGLQSLKLSGRFLPVAWTLSQFTCQRAKVKGFRQRSLREALSHDTHALPSVSREEKTRSSPCPESCFLWAGVPSVAGV